MRKLYCLDANKNKKSNTKVVPTTKKMVKDVYYEDMTSYLQEIQAGLFNEGWRTFIWESDRHVMRKESWGNKFSISIIYGGRFMEISLIRFEENILHEMRELDSIKNIKGENLNKKLSSKTILKIVKRFIDKTYESWDDI